MRDSARPPSARGKEGPVIPIELMVALGVFVIALALVLRWFLTQMV